MPSTHARTTAYEVCRGLGILLIATYHSGSPEPGASLIQTGRMETKTTSHFGRMTALARLQGGPLSQCLDSYLDQLATLGYARFTGRLHLRIVADLNDWMHEMGVSIQDLDQAAIERYLRYRHRKRPARHDDFPALRRLLALVRSQLPADPPKPSFVESIVSQYERYLKEERGLANATIDDHSYSVRQFLVSRYGSGQIDFLKLQAAEVIGFVQNQAERVSTVRTKHVIDGLRSFFRYLLSRGELSTDLAACVPAIAQWPLAGIPRFLTAEQVRTVLRTARQDTRDGRRNYAILLTLARLGLRAGEIVNLRLDDIDWDSGLVTVGGKGAHRTQLPLPTDVGQAIAVYIQRGRPQCSDRHVFLPNRAPIAGPLRVSSVSAIAAKAIARAGVESQHHGAHVFRHSLATHMLNQGASLAEIGELLRHRLQKTTAIYAKVDLRSLRALALPWPGGAR